jgi:hypothetical protein
MTVFCLNLGLLQTFLRVYDDILSEPKLLETNLLKASGSCPNVRHFTQVPIHAITCPVSATNNLSYKNKKTLPKTESVTPIINSAASQMLSQLLQLFFAGLRLCVLLTGIILRTAMAEGTLLRSPFPGSRLQKIQDSIVLLLHS